MIRTALLAASLVLASFQAMADDRLCRGGITAEDAMRIARDAGVGQIQKVECDDGRWEVEGRDPQDRKIEVKIHAGDGRVLTVERNG